MKTLIAILITIGLFAMSLVIARLTGDRHVAWIMILGTAAWAAIDSVKIQLQHYKSGLPYGPVVLFILVAGFWIVGFPWYLAIRFNIKADTAIPRDAAELTKLKTTKELSSERKNERSDKFDY